MKKILIIGLVLLSVFLIYLANMDKKVYYVALGDSLERVYVNNEEVYGYSHYIKKYLKDEGLLERYSDDFAKVDTRITDVINDINSNKKIKTNKGSFSLKNALIKADLITLNISFKDVYNKLNKKDVVYNDVYDYIDDLAYDLERLFKLMREYCKEDIVMVGPYNPFIDESDKLDVYEYFNEKCKDVCLDYDAIYVDLSDINEMNGYIYEVLSNRVINKMSKSLFET